MTANQVISAKILLAMASGMDLPTAYDIVMGDGAYKKFAGEIYDGLVK